MNIKLFKWLDRLVPIAEPAREINTPVRTFFYGLKLIMRGLFFVVLFSVLAFPLMLFLQRLLDLPPGDFLDIYGVGFTLMALTIMDFWRGFLAVVMATNGKVSQGKPPDGVEASLFVAAVTVFFISAAGYDIVKYNLQQWLATRSEISKNLELLSRGRDYWNTQVRNKPVAWETFEGTDLSGMDLRGYYFAGINFRKARLVGTRFDDSCMTYADFRGATLDGASFKGAILDRTRFDKARLRKVDFTGAWLDPKIFQSAAATEGLILDKLQPVKNAFQLTRQLFPNCR
ncbi:MAG TPA: pentapeptide repeat-containing protein [Candidatus Ozemobacteraceae bacterium]|nr:pentapeptide repeat-containing protein [Candidatus Ozemobacteraceae bacterium]